MTAFRPAILAAALTGALLMAGCGGPDAGPPAVAETLAVDTGLRDLLPQHVREAGVLTVATDASYPPASSFAADGRTIVGFEPDLGAALGQLLGVRLEFRPSDFDTMLDDLAAHRVDLVMSAMTHTPERERLADFVTYFEAGSSVVVQRGNPRGISDLAGLCGHRVAVEVGTVQVGLLERGQARCGDAPIRVTTHPTTQDALVELRTGRVDAVVSDYPPAVLLTTDPRTQEHFQLASDVQYEPGRYGVAVAKDRPGVRAAVAGALDRLVGSGVYRDVLDRWSVESGAVPGVTVNGTEPAR